VSKDGVSVIVCCYNSALKIEMVLNHLTGQIINDICCEVILIDNASTDNTGEIARAVWHKTGPKRIDFRVVPEPLPGLSNARLKGITAASFEFLIFFDDDNWLDENYIKNIYKLFKANPGVGIIGGLGSPLFEDISLKPVWFDTFYQGYAVGKQGGNEGIVDNVYGAGMAIRKSILKSVTDKHILFLHGRKGKHLTSGEDSEICLRIKLAGYQILYSPQLTFKHFITSNRLTWDYLKELHIGFAKSHVVISLYNKALASETLELPAFYWLKKGLYYWGIYLKYWPKHYLAYKNTVGTIEEIHHITWKNIALNYFEYNFKTIGIYSRALAFKFNNQA
jgi:glycosyltransferase involved in cell wall biosynthesis